MRQLVIPFGIKSYVLVGIGNTIFAYGSSVILYFLLERYIYDALLFSFCGVINITFSYFTMTLFVFHNKEGMTVKNYSRYLFSSLTNTGLSVFLSVAMIRAGYTIFLTQMVAIILSVLLQLLINVHILGKRVKFWRAD